MAKLFNNIRKKLVADKPSTARTANYLKYAIGEIVLVVIGILIALQVNTWNENKKQKAKEIHYLQNIKIDLNLNILELDKYIAIRNSRIESANIILDYFERKLPLDLEDFNYNNINAQTWKKFYQSNNTFQELINSGNLAIISNDSIKNALLNLELLYKKMKSDEAHMRFDSEEYLFKQYFNTVDLNPLLKNYTYKVSKGKVGEKTKLSRKEAETLLHNLKFKNGFVLSIYINTQINNEFSKMKEKSKQLIRLIKKEVNNYGEII